MLDWNEMQIFERVAARMSVTRAAEELGLPKSTVSRAITRMESRLGLKLIERTTRRLRLTDVGSEYAERAAAMAGLAKEAERELSERRKTPAGLLRVSTPATLLRSFLSPHLAGFARKHPLVEVEFLNPAANVEADLYLRAGSPPEDSSLNLKMLGKVGVALYASPRYVAERGVVRSPEDLTAHSVLGVSRKMQWRLRSGKKEAVVGLTAKWSAPDPVVVIQLAVDGCGVSQAPLFLGRAEERAGRLVRVLPEWEASPVELMAMYPGQSERTPKTGVFLEFLGEAVKKQIALL